MNGILPALKPLPIKERISVIFVERGEIDMLDGAFVVVDATGVRTHIPVGGVACIMLEPGTRVSHRAAALAARVGTLLVWVGEAGVRLYSAGQPGGARSDRLLYQARLALDDSLRLKVVRKMYAVRFGEEPPERRSVEQLRGIEGARVRRSYQLLAQQFGVKWTGRSYDPETWDASDLPNRCLSAATACLYGVTEAAVLAAGYAPAVGFIHTGGLQGGGIQPQRQPRTRGAAGLPRHVQADQAAGPHHSRHRDDAGRGRDTAPGSRCRRHRAGHRQPRKPGRCWSSCLRTRRRGCAAGWPCGCWKCAQASTWATTAGVCASTSGATWKKASKTAMP